MGLRMSGLVSGLDTEAIIKELMSAQSLKKTKIENKITKQGWRQEQWKDINSKIYSFYTGSLSKLKTQGSFQQKKAASSNESKISATASNSAVEGSHAIQVKQLASSQYLTGANIKTYKDTEGKDVKVTTSTKLMDLGMEEGTTINIASGKKSVSYDVTEASSLNDFLDACKKAGLNASYDSTQGRLFLNSASSGEAGAFTITAGLSSTAEEKNAIRDAVGYSKQSSAERTKIDNAILTYVTSSDEDKINSAYALLKEKSINNATTQYAGTIITAYKDGNLSNINQDASDYMEAEVNKAIQDYEDGFDDSTIIPPEEIEKVRNNAISSAASKYMQVKLEEYKNEPDDKQWNDGVNPYADAVAELDETLTEYKSVAGTEEISDLLGNGLSKLGLADITYEKIDGKLDYKTSGDAEIALVGASNSKIIYNGAELESSTNTITANGLTFTAQGITAENETITLTVSKDTDSVYDMVKTVLKEYNELLEEMTGAYNADSAKGYDPLTDEAREAMSEEQINKWEDKIKDSLLRRDSTLNNIISSMKDSFASSIQYNGKAYSLSSFGISTKYYTEKGKLHIAGDSDDPLTMDDKDKLKAALEEDPDAVMAVLSGLAQKLYDDVGSKMKSSKLSSAFTVYNDKQMKTELEKYNEDLKKMESKLKDIEDKYYKQFAALEKAMSTLNSQSNSMASMMGLNTQGS